MSRKQSYVLFQHGEHPRIYVNPSNKDELALKGTLVKKPNNRKLSKVPMEQWLLEDGKIVTPSVTGQNCDTKRNRSITANYKGRRIYSN
jgi:hypothetical protein